MPYEKINKENAIQLRLEGHSLLEISLKTGIPKSTLSKWLRLVELPDIAKTLLLNKTEKTKENLKKGINHNKAVRINIKIQNLERVETTLKNLKMDDTITKLLCAFLYWSEGGKRYGVRFSNSDPSMISTFLYLLRKGFSINEQRLKVLVNIHDYHDDHEIKCYWANVTKIPIDQFYRSYVKPHTGLRKKSGYMGCAHIYYRDWTVVHELMTLYNTFAKNIGT